MEGVYYRWATLSDHISESAGAAPVTETLPLSVNQALAVSSPARSFMVGPHADSSKLSHTNQKKFRLWSVYFFSEFPDWPI